MTHGVLLLDGGMGQELIRRSPSPAHHHWSLQVMLEQPELVAEVHRDFCQAGANVACLNTYAITHTRLARGTGLPPIDRWPTADQPAVGRPTADRPRRRVPN